MEPTLYAVNKIILRYFFTSFDSFFVRNIKNIYSSMETDYFVNWLNWFFQKLFTKQKIRFFRKISQLFHILADSPPWYAESQQQLIKPDLQMYHARWKEDNKRTSWKKIPQSSKKVISSVSKKISSMQSKKKFLFASFEFLKVAKHRTVNCELKSLRMCSRTIINLL